jgi:hypothetical protein
MSFIRGALLALSPLYTPSARELPDPASARYFPKVKGPQWSGINSPSTWGLHLATARVIFLLDDCSGKHIGYDPGRLCSSILSLACSFLIRKWEFWLSDFLALPWGTALWQPADLSSQTPISSHFWGPRCWNKNPIPLWFMEVTCVFNSRQQGSPRQPLALKGAGNTLGTVRACTEHTSPKLWHFSFLSPIPCMHL